MLYAFYNTFVDHVKLLNINKKLTDKLISRFEPYLFLFIIEIFFLAKCTAINYCRNAFRL